MQGPLVVVLLVTLLSLVVSSSPRCELAVLVEALLEVAPEYGEEHGGQACHDQDVVPQCRCHGHLTYARIGPPGRTNLEKSFETV